MNNFENEVKGLIEKYNMDSETGLSSDILARFLQDSYLNLRDTLNRALESE